MIIGRLILAFVSALSRIFPSIKSPKEVSPIPPSPAERRGGSSSPASDPAARPEAGKVTQGMKQHDSHTVDMSRVKGIFGYAKELFKRFSGDQCAAWAASLSFFSILSLPAVLLCGLSVLGFIMTPAQAVEQTQKVVERVLPGQEAQKSVQKIMDDMHVKENVEKTAAEAKKKSWTTGLIGFALLLWSAIQIFVNASMPMNTAFRAEESRGFIKLRLVALALLIGCGLLFVVSLVLTGGVSLIESQQLPFFGGIPHFVLNLISWVVGISVNTALFTLIYRYVPSPSANVTWKNAAIGGIVAAVLWEGAKQGFALYLHNMGGAQGYGKVYGSLGGLVLLVLWIYYTSMILLLGAEIAKLYSDAQVGGAVPSAE